MSAATNVAHLQGTRTACPPEVIAGLSVQVTLDSSDQRIEEKYAALRRGIELVGQRVPGAFHDLRQLPVFFGAAVACEACWEPEGPGGAAALFLGDRMMLQANPVLAGQDARAGFGRQGPRGVPDQLYDDQRKSKAHPARWWREVQGRYQASKASAKATGAVVHELGHLLHERRAPDRFWANKRAGAEDVPAALAGAVSSYLVGKNLDEFVAEVFTGLVHGKTYPPAVHAAYEREGGPTVR